MSGLLGKKIGMTSIYDEAGKMVPVTVIEAGPCVVTQVRTIEKDGYSAIQLGFDEKKVKNTPKAEQGHFAKAGITVILDAFDLFGQLSNVRRTINAQGRTETWSNVTPQYAMLHVLYRLNKKPKK